MGFLERCGIAARFQSYWLHCQVVPESMFIPVTCIVLAQHSDLILKLLGMPGTGYAEDPTTTIESGLPYRKYID